MLPEAAVDCETSESEGEMMLMIRSLSSSLVSVLNQPLSHYNTNFSDNCQDVSQALLFSLDHTLPLSVRSGGHSYTCQSLKVHIF